MKSFETLQYYLRVLGLLESEPPNKKFTIFRRIFALTITTLFWVSSIWFFIYETETAEETSQSILAIAGSSIGFLKYLTFFRNISKVVQVFDYIDDIIKKRHEKRNTYANARNTFQKWTKRFFIFIVGIVGSIFGFAYPIQSFYLYFTNGRSNDVFSLCLPGSYPFVWKTPRNYSIAVLFQSIAVYYGASMMFVLMIFIIGFCFYTELFLSEIEQNLIDLDNRIVAEHPHGTYMNQERHSVIMKFVEIIRFHVEIKQFVSNSFDVFKPSLTVCFVLITMSVCGSLLQLDLGINANNLTEINRSTMSVIIFSGSVFVLCYFGSNLTEKFESISATIDKSVWYLYPIELRRIMPLICCQNPTELSGYLNMKSTRSFFVQLMRMCYSFFMAIRQRNH